MRVKLLFYYSILLSFLIALETGFLGFQSGNMLFFFISLPITIYFLLRLFRIKKLRKLLLYYNFILITIMVISGFIGISSIPQLISAILFLPMALYFWLLVLPKRNNKLPIPDKLFLVQAASVKEERITKGKIKKIDGEVIPNKKFGKNFDLDRRMFLKLIGSTGLMVFMFSIFSKKAEGVFFGSVPGPGTVALKDTTGTLIDPAIKHPTDGYKIARVDDSVPAYYGFIRRDGAWFIMKEGTDSTYKYAKGSASFQSTGWDLRNVDPGSGGLTYADFDAVFG